MEIALFILFFIIFIEILLIGFLFSNVSLNIEKLNINSLNRKITDIYVEKMNVKLQIYIFKYIRILNIKLNKNYFEILKGKIKYEKFFNAYNIKDKIDFYRKVYDLYKVIKENPSKINVRKIKPKLNSLKMNLNISTENSIITSFFTCFLSILISFLLKSNLLNRKYNNSNFNYKIIPIYLNSNSFKLELESNISFNMFSILELIYEYKKITKENRNTNNQKVKESMQEIIKRSIDGFKMIDKVRYVNKRIKVINTNFSNN